MLFHSDMLGAYLDTDRFVQRLLRNLFVVISLDTM